MRILTKKDFQMTKWRVKNKAQGDILVKKAIELKEHPKLSKDFNNEMHMFNQIFFPKESYYADCYMNPIATDEELDKNFEEYKDYKEMIFEDYFENELTPIAFSPEIMSKVRGVCSCGKTNFSLVMDALQGKNDECKYCGDKNYITKEEPEYTLNEMKTSIRKFCKVMLGINLTKEQAEWIDDYEVRFK